MFTLFAILDLCRDALFLWISFVFAALSNREEYLVRIWSASSLFPAFTAFSNCFAYVLISERSSELRRFRVIVLRMSFFEDFKFAKEFAPTSFSSSLSGMPTGSIFRKSQFRKKTA